MPDTNINLVDDSLKVLLQAATDFPNAEIDFCVGYVTASGVLLLKKMFNTAHKARAVVGLCAQNKVSAFQRLQDFGVKATSTLQAQTQSSTPEIPLGATKAQVWAMWYQGKE